MKSMHIAKNQLNTIQLTSKLYILNIEKKKKKKIKKNYLASIPYRDLIKYKINWGL